jgi:uncharacterized glyoxalase superfamily protein PhnB
MPSEIAPILAVSDGNAAIGFYKAAFDATVLWHLNGGGHAVVDPFGHMWLIGKVLA